MFKDQDDYLFAVRDEPLHIAKKALHEADITAHHAQLDQGLLFFIAARQDEGALELAKLAIAKGVEIDCCDMLRQTPLFYCAKVGNLELAKYLVSIGMNLHFRDQWKQTALFYAISEGHMAMVRWLVAAGSSLDVKSSSGRTPLQVSDARDLPDELKLLKAEQQKLSEDELKGLSQASAQTKKRKRTSTQSRNDVCTWSKTRDKFLAWVLGKDAEEDRSLTIDPQEVNVLAEDDSYFACQPPLRAAKRLRRGERQLVFEHAELCRPEDWYNAMKPDDWCHITGVRLNRDRKHMSLIQDSITGADENGFTLAAVSKDSGAPVGYVTGSRNEDMSKLNIFHVQVDRPHQGRGLGRMLIHAAEQRSSQLGWGCRTTSLKVLQRNYKARICYEKDNFKVTGSTMASFHKDSKRKERWLQMSRKHSLAPAEVA